MQNDIIRPPQPPRDNQLQQPIDQIVPAGQVQAQQPRPVNDVAPTGVLSQEPVPNSNVPNQQQPDESDKEPNGNKQKPGFQEPTPKKKSGKPKGVIIVAVVLFVALAAAAVYLGMNAKDKNDSTKDTQKNVQTDQSNQNAQTADQSEIDSVVSEADALTDASDDLETGMSEQSLGL